jgi:hypothetical protein
MGDERGLGEECPDGLEVAVRSGEATAEAVAAL